MRLTTRKNRFTALLACLALLGWAPASLATTTYQLLFVGDKKMERNAWRGAQLGLQESNHQASFLGVKFELTTVAPSDYDPALLNDTIAVLVADDANTVREIIEATSGVPVLNLLVSSNDLRDACYNHAFHVLPSDSMYMDAEDQWLQQNPGSQARAYGWHHTFDRYAARDLNRRFTRDTGGDHKMNDEAWAGWAAVKIAAESVMRMQSGDPGELVEYFRNDLFFDAQKGYEVNFRPDGQLRQLILLIENEEIVGEAPVRGVVEDESDLDTLGEMNC